MSTLFTWGRFLFATLVLGLLDPHATATGQSSTTSARSATTDATGITSEHVPAGDPALGVLIIIGIVGFLIVIAWLFSRVGDDRNRGPDRTLL